MTQSVATLGQAGRCIPTGCYGLDKLLDGGLQPGHILEISGPPGSPKEVIARNLIVQFARRDHRTIIVGNVTRYVPGG